MELDNAFPAIVLLAVAFHQTRAARRSIGGCREAAGEPTLPARVVCVTAAIRDLPAGSPGSLKSVQGRLPVGDISIAMFPAMIGPS